MTTAGPPKTWFWDQQSGRGGAFARVIDRFVIRAAATGFCVVDVWTGETVLLAMTPQNEMSEEDAEHTAKMLNERAERGERQVHE